MKFHTYSSELSPVGLRIEVMLVSTSVLTFAVIRAMLGDPTEMALAARQLQWSCGAGSSWQCCGYRARLLS
jgi:hypothetical protein